MRHFPGLVPRQTRAKGGPAEPTVKIKISPAKEVALSAEPSSLSPARLARQVDRRQFAKQIIGGMIIVSAVIVAVAGCVLWQLRQNTIATALSDLDAFDLLLAAQTERTFQNVDLVLSDIVEDLHDAKIESSAALRRVKDDAQTYRLLREKLSGVPQLDALGLASAEGDAISLTPAYPVSQVNIADRDYFIALRDHPELDRFISMPVENRVSGAWTIFVAHRVSAPDGSFLGLVVGAMTLRYFEEFFRDVSPAAGKGINLWRVDGTLLARHPVTPGTIGQVFVLDDEFRKLAVRGGAALFWTKGSFTAGTLAVAERKLPNLPLIVAVGLTQAAILAPWHTQVIVMASGVATILLTLSLAAWLMFRQLSAYGLIAEARTKAGRESEARQEFQRAVERTEQAVRDLRASKSRFRDIAEVSGDWIWESDASHRLTSVLGDAVFHDDTHGISSIGAVGKTRWEMAGADPETDARWQAHKADLDAHRPFRDFRFSVVALTGQRLHFRVAGKPVFDEMGQFLGFRGTASNETGLVDALHRAERADALLREAIESITEGFAIYDHDDRLVMCNQAYKDLYPESAGFMVPGASFEEILRGGLSNGQYPDAVGREAEWLADRLRYHRQLDHPPVEQPLRDGRWAMISERRTSSGGRAGLRIDITALKKVQQSLHESQERLARAQRVANTGSIERDLRTDRVVWSDETYRIMGVRRGTITPSSQSFIDMIHPDDRQMVIERLSRRAIDDHADSDLRYRIIRPDGEVRAIYAEADVVHDKDGKPARVVAVLKDVTEAEAATRRQAQLEMQLRHSEKLTALGTLAGGIAHDLNNTLVPIQALSKLLTREFAAGSPARADLETIIQASMQARDLVRQILAFSRKQDMVKQPVDLVAVTRKSLQMLRASIPRTVDLVERLEPVPPMLADAGQLHQVVINLVTNAAHAIGDRIGKITVSVAPATAKNDDVMSMIRLTVTDTGSGMDEDTAHRIFEPFYTTKPVGEGTGLGLSVVHGIVTGHDGTIEVRSKPGVGSEFIIRLPSCEPHASDTVAECATA